MATASRSEPRTGTPRPQQIDYPGFPITAEDTVVDVGCGDGLVCEYAGWQGAEVVGIDAEAHLIDIATERMRGVPASSFRGIVSDADPIPLPDGWASVVVATEVMEHVDDPRRFLAELVRIGGPGARYLISVPHPASEDVMRFVAPAWYWQRPLHVRVFRQGELESMLESSGLALQGRYSTGFYWSMWWFLRMALGMDHIYAAAPDDRLLLGWEEVVQALLKTPGGSTLLRELDRIIPKSQVVIARKLQGRGAISVRGGMSWRMMRLKHRLKEGAIRLGGFELSWKVRRAKAS